MTLLRFFFPGLLLLAACQSKPEPAAEAPAEAPAKPASADKISLSAEQVRAAGISTGGFAWRNMTNAVQANGTIEVPPQNRVDISAVMGGYVQSVQVLTGQRVAKGATVAILRHPDYLKVQQDYLQSRARVAFLRQELDRQQTLDAEDVGAKRKLQQAQADYATEQAAQRALAAQVQMLGLSVARLNTGYISPTVALTTPLGGYVTAVNMNPGQFVNPQDVLVEILDRSDLHLELKVFERDIARVKVGQRILFTIPNRQTGEEMVARVFLVGRAFNPEARTVTVHAHLEPNREDLIPGQYVRGSIQTEGSRQRTLPEDAIIQAGEISYVFAQTAAAGQPTFHRYKAATGASDGGTVAVTLLEPVPDTLKMVQHGAYFLQAELAKGSGEGE
ncbi:efflux RND transporter periplasmic adaptor subunit [Hymenobacter psychrotolerans]|uniref:Membrane fusion protein, cobalt-zinc-cadmium efflux system n=1 Tax=Hymenobacter psychrotolerans DSM 18569 TaxID=1121959 RepID=A0A1M7GPY5_9BACT|nr:efflux RND transporter periplasmic adaptor subunit [Hymenobacter psychrotolerans]SHM18241.1 membrane fusion protein, cobalt-zinc-cadmium efflux system [Hymenobacter psychrotolerans DSM 18569]